MLSQSVDSASASAFSHSASFLVRLPARSPSSFQLGLSTLPELDGEAVAGAIAAHEDDLVARRETLQRRSEGELPFHVAAMFDLALTQVEAELGWIRRFGAEFQEHRRTERTEP